MKNPFRLPLVDEEKRSMGIVTVFTFVWSTSDENFSFPAVLKNCFYYQISANFSCVFGESFSDVFKQLKNCLEDFHGK